MTENPFSNIHFLLSVAGLEQLPQDTALEVAFVGRSNAGKSTALNAITGKRALARVSKTPGRTQLINMFRLGEQDDDTSEGHLPKLVDLPGYGYAQVPEKMRQNWGKLVGGYLEVRDCLAGLIVVMDIRHPMMPHDEMMLDWAQAFKRPVHILLTKSDKLAFGKAKNILLKVQKDLSDQPLCSVQLFSGPGKRGVEEARDIIKSWLNMGST